MNLDGRYANDEEVIAFLKSRTLPIRDRQIDQLSGQERVLQGAR